MSWLTRLMRMQFKNSDFISLYWKHLSTIYSHLRLRSNKISLVWELKIRVWIKTPFLIFLFWQGCANEITIYTDLYIYIFFLYLHISKIYLLTYSFIIFLCFVLLLFFCSLQTFMFKLWTAIIEQYILGKSKRIRNSPSTTIEIKSIKNQF